MISVTVKLNLVGFSLFLCVVQAGLRLKHDLDPRFSCTLGLQAGNTM